MKFTKKDLIFSIVTGLIAGVIAWQILNFLNAPSFGLPTAHPHSLFVIIIPILWIVGVNFGYFLGRWIGFFNQFGKFVAVGFTNFFVDMGVLNLEIGLTGIESGWYYSLFKTVSFMVGVTNSYILNKFWVFEASSSGGGRSELFKFLGVNVFAIIINVGIASFVVNFMDPVSGLDAKTWANVGSVAGSAVALVFTFVGARLIVFKKNDAVSQI